LGKKGPKSTPIEMRRGPHDRGEVNGEAFRRKKKGVGQEKKMKGGVQQLLNGKKGGFLSVTFTEAEKYPPDPPKWDLSGTS